ncbi:MAG: autotransporter outer membrane beta-barrel domain-containing protein [Gammaproteobacteria bacterium]|nr:autotransporter outer membrane beta-barrel domain-containing protein [Gammaproteobacteria bacterium]
MLAAVAAGALATGVEDFVSAELRRVSDSPVQSAVGTVIGQICPSGTIITDADLQARCDEIAVAGVVNPAASKLPGVRDALQAMGDEEAAVVATSKVDGKGAQVDAIGQRLSALRAGGGVTGGVVQRANGFDWAGGAAGDGAAAPWGFWVSGMYANSDRDTTAREAGFEADDYGVTFGVDYAVSDMLVLGLAGGYRNTDADIDNNGGKLDSDSYSVFAYWSLYPSDNFFVDATVGYTNSDHDQERNIIYSIAAVGGGTTTVNNTALSDTDSDEWSASVAAGRRYDFGNWALTPQARFEYADVEIDGFTESMANTAAAGAGLALQVASQSYETMQTAAGATLGTHFDTSWGAVFPEISFEYVHEFKNNNDPVRSFFVNDSSRTTIVLLTDRPDRNFFNVGAGLSTAFSDSLSGYVRYQGLFGYRDLDVHMVEVQLRATF